MAESNSPINHPAASRRGINIITSHRRRPVSTNEPLDSGIRRNDDIRSKLRGIEPSEIQAMRGGIGLLVGFYPLFQSQDSCLRLQHFPA